MLSFCGGDDAVCGVGSGGVGVAGSDWGGSVFGVCSVKIIIEIH